jgi:site-specific DNA-methyltransferase (adenine-specific)
MWNGFMQGKSMNQGEVMNPIKEKNERRIHPTQKPVELYRWLLDKYATPCSLVLDTHLGSGSSAIAAHRKGTIYFTGCELDPIYYAGAKKRFKEQTAQIAAF